MMGASPPGPLRWGSTTCSTKAVATAASKALPPPSRTAMPAAEASQWVLATMPNRPASSGRVGCASIDITLTAAPGHLARAGTSSRAH